MRLTNVLRPALMAIALLAAMSVATTRSNAQISLVLDNPSQTVVRPDPGNSGIVDFTGTLSIDKGYQIVNVSLDFPANATNTFSLFTTFSGGPAIFSANDGNTYSGLLFSVLTDWTIDLDYYAYLPGTLTPALYTILALNTDLGALSIASVPFSVTVTGPAAVPEPGNAALFATTALSGMGLLIRRRKSRKQA